MLAELLRTGFLAEAWIAPRRVREERQLQRLELLGEQLRALDREIRKRSKACLVALARKLAVIAFYRWRQALRTAKKLPQGEKVRECISGGAWLK